MKKALIITLSSFLLLLGLTLAFNATESQKFYKLEYTLDTLSGDPGLLNGLNITQACYLRDFNANSSRKISRDTYFWKSSLNISNGQVESNDVFLTADKDMRLPAPYLQLEVPTDLTSTRIVYDFMLKRGIVLDKHFPGDSLSLNTNEIFSYYPLSFAYIEETVASSYTYSYAFDALHEDELLNSLRDPHYTSVFVSKHQKNKLTAYNAEKLQEFFKIPVIENEIIEIPLSINYSFSYRNHKDYYDFDSIVEDGEDAYFIAISSHTRKGAQVDTSQIPGGYGIYLLPYAYVDKTNYKGMAEYSGFDLLTDELRLLAPLDPSAYIRNLDYDSSEKTLYVLTEENSEFTEYVIDTVSGEILAKVALGTAPAELSTLLTRVGDGFVFINLGGYKLSVVGKNDLGSYEELLSLAYVPYSYELIGCTLYGQAYNNKGFKCLFRDGKYYIFSQGTFVSKYDYLFGYKDGFNSILVFVISENGLEYSGVIQSSLDDACHSVSDRDIISPRSYFNSISWEGQ